MINMMDVREIKVDLENLANQLDGSDERAAMRLRNLTNAVLTGNNADAWTAADIHRLIAPDLIAERYKRQRTTNWLIITLEGLRNTLIFVPLVVTWFGISQAVTKYSDLITEKPNDIQLPFLFLWERGFDGQLPAWQTLGTLAWIDFVLLVGVVILTFIVLFLSDQVRGRRETEAEELRARLIHSVASASLYLNKNYKPGAGGAVNSFNQSLTRFDNVIQQLLQQIDNISNKQGQQQQFFDNFKRDLVTIMTRVSGAVTELKTSNEALTQNMNNLVQPVRDMANQAGPLTAKATEAVEEFKKQIVEQQRVVQSLDNWGQQLTGVLNGVDQAVQRAIAMSNSINKFTQDQSKHVDAIEQERIAQGQVLAEVKLVARNMKVFLDEIETCSIRLSNSVKYMDDATRHIATLTADMSKAATVIVNKLK